MLPSHVRLILCVVVVVVLVVVGVDVVGVVVSVVDGVDSVVVVVVVVLCGEHNFLVVVGVIGLGVVGCLRFLFAAMIGFLEMYCVVGWCCRVWWCWWLVCLCCVWMDMVSLPSGVSHIFCMEMVVSLLCWCLLVVLFG